MIVRKLKTTLLATPLSLFVIFTVFFGEWRQPLELIVMTGVFSIWIAPFILLYAVPVTFFSDLICKRLNENRRRLYSFIIHLCFGVLFGFIYPMNAEYSLFGWEIDFSFIFASITALIFWLIDELLRRTKSKQRKVKL